MTIKELIQGLKKMLADEFKEFIQEEVNKYVNEVIDKQLKKIFVIAVAASLTSIGSLMLLYGFASEFDRIFKMGGISFIIFGLFGILIGLLIYDRWIVKLKK